MVSFRFLSFAMVVSVALVTPCFAQTPECRDGPGTRSTECGTGSTTSGNNTTAMGSGAHAVGNRSTAVGARADALAGAGEGATAVGGSSLAAGENTTAVGWAAGVGSPNAGANGGTAVGAGANVLSGAEMGTALGFIAQVRAADATALGARADADFAGSTAIGAGSATRRSNQVMLGGAGTSVTIGDIAASTTVQAGPLALMTVDATGTVGRDTGTMATINGALKELATASAAQVTRTTTLEQGQASQGMQISALQNADVQQAHHIATLGAASIQQASQIASLGTASALHGRQIVELQNHQAALFNLADINRRDIHKANEGIAMALAMESPGLPAGTSFALSGGVGYYNGRTAATTAISARVGDRSSLSAGVGVGFDSGEVGARAGFQVAW